MVAENYLKSLTARKHVLVLLHVQIGAMKQKAEEIISDVNSILAQTTIGDEDGLLRGNGGLALYYFYVGHVMGNEAYLQKGNELITSIFEKIQNGNSTLMGHNFSNGIVGFCIILNILVKQGILDLDLNESLEAVDEYIYDSCLNEMKAGNVDILHQSFGALYYFASRNGMPKSKEYLNNILGHLFDKAVIDTKGFRYVSSSGPNEGKIYDLSYAHGLCGHISILLKIYKLGIMEDVTAKAIDGALNFIFNSISQQNLRENISYLPLGIDIKEEKPYYSSMLAWCYGDLNFLKLFIELKSTKFYTPQIENQIEILIAQTSKRDIIDAKINDSHFCHGSSGAYFMFYHLNSIFNNYNLQEASFKWFDINYTLFKNDIKRYHYQNKETHLLEGMLGPALVSLSILSDEYLHWKEAFLL